MAAQERGIPTESLIASSGASMNGKKDLVLIGGGHAHVHVLKVLGDTKALSDLVNLTVISPVRYTPYSGMLPGYLAGHYTHEQIHLDVLKLTQHAGGRFVHLPASKVTNTEQNGGYVHLQAEAYPQEPIHYDCLSINIGSSPGSVPTNAGVIPVKPISTFCKHYEDVLQHVTQHTGEGPYKISVVGGGAGGVELALALQHRMATTSPSSSLKITILTRSSAVLESHGPAVQRKFQRILRERKIAVITGTVALVHNAEEGQQRIILNNGEEHLVDACFWCATAESAKWLSESTPFRCTEKGNFLCVKDTYECSVQGVFAAGDCCFMEDHPRPRAGVFAVRAGPILAENIVRYIKEEKELIHHRPQERFLQLISTGDHYAVASRYSQFAVEGKWLWNLKDRIDRKWMEKYTID